MKYDKNTVVFLNNEWLRASDAARELQHQSFYCGNGVFEGLRSYATNNGFKVLKANEHFERLLYSAEKLNIHLSYNPKQLSDICNKLLQVNNLKDAYIRPLVYTNDNLGMEPQGHTNLFMSAWEWKHSCDKPYKIMTSSFKPSLFDGYNFDAKITENYTHSMIASKEAREKGFDEALLLDPNGFVSEARGANFFFQKGNVLYTAPAGNILPGITRSLVMKLARDSGIQVVEYYFTPEQVYDADCAFLTGTAVEVNPVESLDNYKFKKDWDSSFGHELQQKFLDYARA